MDHLDRTIVDRLQEDARQTNRELAAAVGVSPSTALERTRALRARGVISGYHAEIDPASLGRNVQALVAVRVRPQSRETIESVRDRVLRLPETVAVFVTTGAEDIYLHVAVPNTPYLRDFVLDHLAQRKDIVDVRTTVVYDYMKKTRLGSMAEDDGV